ncbi:hypothetical protein BD779DRAFT_1667805 [Infundibulicybe gibba]|nr:hypothetical protein BD779DRAFT_1667805 [Infundibulicybe gibba]
MDTHELTPRFETINLSPRADCESPDPANTVTDRLNTLLNSSGPGYILNLCPGRQYILQAPLLFAAPQQEISTSGYPTGDTRATLVVNGPVANGKGHTTAVDGTCATCSGVKLRNVQIDGTRGNASPTEGGANIEMGGQNSDQLIEYVHSSIREAGRVCTFRRGLSIAETFQEWADGISLSCTDSIVRNNMIQGATDGGIVLFGSPGSQVYNNTIWVLNQTLLGGINMVDYEPFKGNYTGTVVRNNSIFGGFATDTPENGDSKGNNFKDAIIKIGIAIGPRTWFAPHHLSWDPTPHNRFNYKQTSNLLLMLTHDMRPPPDGGDYWPYGGNPSNTTTSSGYPLLLLAVRIINIFSGGSNKTIGIAVGVVVGVLAALIAAWHIRKWALARAEAKRHFNTTKEISSETDIKI